MMVTRHLRVIQSTERDVNMEKPIRVAFASTDSKRVNQHFGSAKNFCVFDLTPVSSHQVEIMEFGVLAQDGNEDKLEEKLKLLEECTAVYCQAAGPSAIKRLLALSIQPVKVSENASTELLMNDAGKAGFLCRFRLFLGNCADRHRQQEYQA